MSSVHPLTTRYMDSVCIIGNLGDKVCVTETQTNCFLFGRILKGLSGSSGIRLDDLR